MPKDPVSISPEPITIVSAIAVDATNDDNNVKNNLKSYGQPSKVLTVSPEVAPNNYSNDDSIFGWTLKGFYVISTVISIWIFINARPKYKYSNDGTREISDAYRHQVVTCCEEVRPSSNENNRNGGLCPLIEKDGHRILGEFSSNFTGDEGIFDVFLDRPDIICYITVLVILCIIIWFYILQYYTKLVVICTEVIKMASIVFCAVYSVVVLPDNSTSRLITFLMLVGVSIYGSYVYSNFDYIMKAVDFIRHSTDIIGKNGGMTYKLIVLKIVYALQSALLLITICLSYEVLEVTPISGSCYFVSPAYLKYANAFQIFVWTWTVWTFDMIRLMIVATVTGSNYFHGYDSPLTPSFSESLFRAFGKSFGTLSFAGLVTSFFDALRKRNKRFFVWIGPQVAVLLCIETILCLLGTCILHFAFVLTKFAVVIHAFSGKSLVDSGRHCHQIMTRRFIGGFVTEISSHSIIWTTSIIFSIITSMISWGYIDAAFNCTSFKDQAWLLIFIIIGLCFIHPVVGVLVTICMSMTYQQSEVYSLQRGDATYQHIWIPPLVATFIGFVTKLTFTYVGNIILDAIDTLLVCFAIDEDNGVEDRMTGGVAMIIKSMDDYIKAEPVVHHDVEAKAVQSGMNTNNSKNNNVR